MNPLRIYLLGVPSVRWGEAFLSISRRRVRALLFRLAIDLRPVSREHLATLLWTNVCDTTAHRDLSHLLTHLRNALPDPACLAVESDFVCLDERRVWSDTAAFMDLLRQTRVPPIEDAAGEAEQLATRPGQLAVLGQAAALYRGPLMDGFFLDEGLEFDEWLTIERLIWERRFQLLFTALQRAGAIDENLPLRMQHVRYEVEDEADETQTSKAPGERAVES